MYYVNNFQEELFKIMHTILVNSETRDAAMAYLMAGVTRNQKRSQIQVDRMRGPQHVAENCTCLYPFGQCPDNFCQLL